MDTKVIVLEHCVKKLAQILYDCVECPGDRADVDWTTAQNYIDGNSWVVDAITKSLVKYVVKDGERDCIFGDQITVTIECTFEKFDQLFGRYIWDACYQRIKLNLPHPPYQGIRTC